MNSKMGLPNGTIVNNRYTIVSQLGKGGFGVTYKVQNYKGKIYAMKEYFPVDLSYRDYNNHIIPNNQENEEYFKFGLERFHQEAEILNGLNHLNIVKVFEYFHFNGTSYYIMDYLEGETLLDYLNKKGKLTQDEALEIIMPILEALKELHNKGLIHRDVKPENIYMHRVEDSFSPILIDFGAVKIFDNEKIRELSKFAVFSNGYAPPEQYTVVSEKNYSTDIYAVGAILYEMITGERLPISQSRIAKDTIIKLSEIKNSSYSKEFLTATEFAIELKIENRPQSVRQFQEVLMGKKAIEKPIENLKDSGLIKIAESKSKNKLLISIFTFIVTVLVIFLLSGQSSVLFFLITMLITGVVGGVIYRNSNRKIYHLIPINDKLPIISLKVNQSIKVGRGASCDVIINNISDIDTSYISQTHLQLYALDSGLYVKDIGSQNGVYINNQLLLQDNRVILKSGDKLCIANENVCYRVSD